MRGRTYTRRSGLVVALLLVGMAACRDNGLPDRNLPLMEARNRTYQYPVYERSADPAALHLAGRAWSPSLPVETIPARLLVPVGTAAGTTLFAMRGMEAPYSRLYSPAGGDRWRPYLRLN